MNAIARCAAAACPATAPPIVAASWWLTLDFRGRRMPACSAECAMAVLAELVTVGGFARRPAPEPGPFDPAGERLPDPEVTAQRHDGMTAGRR